MKELWEGLPGKHTVLGKIYGPKKLEYVKTQRKWMLVKNWLCPTGFKWENSYRSFFFRGICDRLLSSWGHKYQTYGYNGLKSEKRGRLLSKEPIMNKKSCEW